MVVFLEIFVSELRMQIYAYKSAFLRAARRLLSDMLFLTHKQRYLQTSCVLLGRRVRKKQQNAPKSLFYVEGGHNVNKGLTNARRRLLCSSGSVAGPSWRRKGLRFNICQGRSDFFGEKSMSGR